MQLEQYDLRLDIDNEKLSYDGIEEVLVKADSGITLNATKLEIKGVSVDDKEVKYTYDGNELVIPGPIKEKIGIKFSGNVSSGLTGFYKASYDGSHLLTTQFEAMNARRMFPCVDDPSVKARFKLTVIIDDELQAISNSPIESTKEDGKGKKAVAFMSTPPMSTYLLYVGVGRFEEKRDKVGDTELIVATIPGRSNEGMFGLTMAKSSISFYENYFKIRYQLPKMHLIAIPQYAHGAMENWGAITFRETALLISQSSSNRAKRRVADVVAHEIAHQWFGDLVTMKWWDDLWLNESFATFMSFKAIDSFKPDWMIWYDFILGETGGALTRDSISTTHPIHVKIQTPDEVEQVFDDISYGKGASILRMIEYYMGAERFRQGVADYLAGHKYSNATAEQLWEALDRAATQPVKSIMDYWITQPGYPLIRVKTEVDGLKLTQERFSLAGKDEGQIWPIPLTARINGETRSILMAQKELKVPAKSIESAKLNVESSGFYRVKYDDLDRAWRAANSPLDRWGLLNDVFALLLRGEYSMEDYYVFIKRYYEEDSYLPAWEASSQLAALYSIAPRRTKEAMTDFHKTQLNVLNRKADENTLMFRGIVTERLALVDDSYAESLAQLFDQYNRFQPDMKQALLIGYVRMRENSYDTLMKLYSETNKDEEKLRVIAAIMNTPYKHQFRKGIELLESGRVKDQDLLSAFQYASLSIYNRDETFAWFQRNIGKLRSLYMGTSILGSAIARAIPFLGIGRADSVKSFLSNTDIPEATVGIKSALELLDIYLRLSE